MSNKRVFSMVWVLNNDAIITDPHIVAVYSNFRAAVSDAEVLAGRKLFKISRNDIEFKLCDDAEGLKQVFSIKQALYYVE